MSRARAVRKSPTVSAPQFKECLSDISATSLGSSVSLECHVIGYPRPEIRWEKDGKAVLKCRNVHMIRSGDRCVLQIKCLQKKDLGRYECAAVNIIGSAITRAHVVVSGLSASSASSEINLSQVRKKDYLAVPSTIRARSRSSERNSNRQVTPAWRSSSCSINSRTREDIPPKEVKDPSVKETNLFGRLSRVSKRCKNEPKPELRNKVNHTIHRVSDKHSENSNMTSFTTRLIAKIKIPQVFKQQNENSKAHHRESAPGMEIFSKQKPSALSPPLNRRNRGLTSLGQSATNKLLIKPEPKSNSVKETWSKLTQKKNLPKEKAPVKSELKLEQPKVNSMNHSKNHSLPCSEYGEAKPYRNKLSAMTAEVDDLFVRDIDGHSYTILSPGNFETDVKLANGKHRILGNIDNTVASFPNCLDQKITHENYIAQVIAKEKLGVCVDEVSPTSKGPYFSMDSICRIVDNILHDIAISSNLHILSPNANDSSNDDSFHQSSGVISGNKNAFKKEDYEVCNGVHLNHLPTEISEENVKKGEEHVAVETAPRSQEHNSTSNAGGRPIPEICIQQIAKGDEFCECDIDDALYVSHETERAFAYSDNGSPSTDQVCTETIGYSTPNIEEECETLAFRPMTPVREEKCHLEEVEAANQGQVGVDLQKIAFSDEHPARIVRGPQSVTALRGESVTLAIHFAGCPTPSVIWSKGGTALTDEDRTSILVGKDMSVLTVNKVTADDSGKYVVCVENEGGGDSCYASVAVVGFPEPPGGEPTASDFTDHSLVLSWYGSMYDGGSVVTGYVVEMCYVPERRWERVASCENTCYTVQGLSCGQRYIFRVRAENKFGLSHPSRASQTICLDEYLGENFYQREESVEMPREPVVVETGIQLSEKYELKEEVGKGRFGTVYRCIEIASGRPRAAKIIRCIKIKDKEKVRQEVHIMNRLHHPKLLKILAAFENGRNMIMITEYISGGELFERVIADDFILTESDCVIFMRQICDGVAYMHQCSVIHLDLKPENILCKTRTSHQIQIIDFGLAREFNEEDNLRILFGTPEFVAPEVINYEPVGPPSDMWSVGVICYVLLSGLSPFMGETDSETFANITRGDIDFDEEAFQTISQDAKKFISSLLVKKPKKRILAQECLKHPWLERAASWTPISTDKLKKFIIRRKWQKSGTAIRALGRMVSLSRSSAGSSWESPSPLGSPTSIRSRSLISSRSESNGSNDSEVFKDSDSVDLNR